MSWLFRRMTPAFWSDGDRTWYGALGVSSLVHIGAILLLSGLWFTPEPLGRQTAVETVWAPAAEMPEVVRIETDHAVAAIRTPMPDIGGGRWAGPPDLAAVAARATGPSVTAADFLAETPSSDELRERVPETLPGFMAGGGGKSMGVGLGEAAGSGTGGGFFGAMTEGKSIVYVVDRSKSMNHPHDSEAKTRFRRVKYELLKSVGLMDESFTFFVIYFNDEAHPMPAPSMQIASTAAKERYLTWVATMDAVGMTDPRTSLQMALRLRPDIVYFLTDGSFDKGVSRQLVQLRQKGTVIHTFAIGSAEGEPTLRAIAEANGGTYRFVP